MNLRLKIHAVVFIVALVVSVNLKKTILHIVSAFQTAQKKEMLVVASAQTITKPGDLTAKSTSIDVGVMTKMTAVKEQITNTSTSNTTG